MKNLYAKLSLFVISYGFGWFGSIRRYKNMAQDIREKYGELNWENYSEFVKNSNK